MIRLSNEDVVGKIVGPPRFLFAHSFHPPLRSPTQTDPRSSCTSDPSLFSVTKVHIMRLLAILLTCSFSGTSAWLPYASLTRQPLVQRSRPTTARHALDYNDPVVAEEFANVQPMDFDDVEAELIAKGIPVPAAMNEMDVKLMLVEMRLRMAGKLSGQKPKKRPDKFSSKFEEAMWTKPAFAEFYEGLKAKGDHNAQNVIAEYVNHKELALQRYGKGYEALIKQCEEALTAPPPVKSTTIKFSGFPANMGEQACRMTLESLGAVVEFECEQDEDFPVLKGKVTFEEIDSAKKAVAQYNGMDMGMGTALELVSV